MPRVGIRVVQAAPEDHKSILVVSHTSEFTKSLSEVRYIRDYYANGWMAKAMDGDRVVGFSCIRHCLRSPWSTVYYTGVDPACRGRGIGKLLLRWLASNSPYKEIRLGIDERNVDGLAFFTKMGFVPILKNGEPFVRVGKKGQRIAQYKRSLPL